MPGEHISDGKDRQQNATGAEEYASAAEVPASQPQSFTSFVEDLGVVIGGGRTGGAGVLTGKAVPKDKIENQSKVRPDHPCKAPKAASARAHAQDLLGSLFATGSQNALKALALLSPLIRSPATTI